MWQVASAKAKLVQSKRVKFLPEEEGLSLQASPRSAQTPFFFFTLRKNSRTHELDTHTRTGHAHELGTHTSWTRTAAGHRTAAGDFLKYIVYDTTFFD